MQRAEAHACREGRRGGLLTSAKTRCMKSDMGVTPGCHRKSAGRTNTASRELIWTEASAGGGDSLMDSEIPTKTISQKIEDAGTPRIRDDV